jgi:predicted RNA-binding Zn-ribbon protein involved in translation (DUF1610 family)
MKNVITVEREMHACPSCGTVHVVKKRKDKKVS